MKKLLYLLLLIPILARGQTTMTDAEMTSKALQIKNETSPGANTKERFAYLFQRLIDSKINLSQLAYVVASGTDTYTATIAPVPPSLSSLRVFVYFTNANTGASTINFNGLGATSIVSGSGGALSSGDIGAGTIKLLSYNGTAFQIIGGGGAATTVTLSGDVSGSGTTSISTTLATVTVAKGGTGNTSLTAYAPVFGGTTSTAATQSGTVGSSGQHLTSNGAGALPTFQNNVKEYGIVVFSYVNF